jgi:hypothetical protein
MKLLISALQPILLLSLIVCFSCQSAKQEPKYSLLVWEKTDDTSNFASYRFTLSKFTVTDSGFTKQEIYRDSIPTEMGYHDMVVSMYENRYVIGHRGNIFDMAEKKFIYRNEDMDHFVKQTNDSVIFSRNQNPFYFLRDRKPRMNINSQYYFFDLRTKKIVEITSGDSYRLDRPPPTRDDTTHYPFEKGSISPDGKRLVYFLRRGKGNEIWPGLDTIKSCYWSKARAVHGELWMLTSPADSVKLMDSVSMMYFSGSADEFSIQWIDNETILAEYDWGKLAKINTRTGGIKRILMEEKPLDCPVYTVLSKSPAGKFIYKCITPDHILFSVDLEKEKLVPEPIPIVNNIRYESLRPNYDSWGIYRHNGKKLFDDDSLSTEEHAVIDHFIAIKTEKYYPDTTREVFGYMQKIYLFDTSGRKLAETTIGVDRLHQLVGWIKE